MEVKIDADAIFTSPLDRLEEVSLICQPKRRMLLLRNLLPASFGEERFASTSLNGPIRERDSHEVEPSACDFRKILLCLSRG